MPNHVTNKLLFHPCAEKRFNEILADLQKKEQNPALLILEGLSPSRKDSSWVTSVLRK